MDTQQGFLAIVAILLIVVIGFVGLAISAMFIGSARSTTDTLQATKAFYLAEAGFQQATHNLLTPLLSKRLACSTLSLNNTLGDGAYLVSGTGPFYSSSATALNGAINAVTTSIPVTSTASYQ